MTTDRAGDSGKRGLARKAAGALAAFASLAALCLAGVAQAQTADDERPRGYIDPALMPDVRVFLPAPPDDDSRRGVVDHVTFLMTRGMQGTDRWELAVRDSSTDPDSVMDAFSCAIGARLDRRRLPETNLLLTRVRSDIGPPVGESKEIYYRIRPFVAMTGSLCADTSYLSGSGSYPSGHTAVGWIYALVMTQLAPDRAAEILARGRVYGESRVVCGAHYPSDVEGGRLVATAVFGLLQSSPDYIADLERAKAEIQAARASAVAPDSMICAVEREAAANPTW